MNDNHSFNVPILFLVFNRPETTQRVFAAIRNARPSKLYISADGPREDKDGEKERCQKVKEIIAKVDWSCEVKTLFREKNLGCKIAVSSAIDWFFENVDEGIILEDDCLPNPSFFTYCETLLYKYRHNDQIMHIGGTNFQNGQKRGNASYYYSHYNHVWGWATWRRAWIKYDLNMSGLLDFISKHKINKIVHDGYVRKIHLTGLILTKQGKINTWDLQWKFSLWVCNGLSIIPNVNLVENIGYGDGATHTHDKNDSTLLLMKNGIINKIIPPDFIYNNVDANLYHETNEAPKTYVNKLKVILEYYLSYISLVLNVKSYGKSKL